MKLRNTLKSILLVGILATGAFATDKQQSFTGIVSDNMCGKQHMAKDKSAAQCTRECVTSGSDYALVVGDKVYTLTGDKAQIDKFAGEKATVNGTAKGETITVTSIAAPKTQ
jgi:hypothetical protein